MIKLTFNRTAFTASASMSDFYNEVGVASYMEYGTVKSLNQVWANEDEMEVLRKAMRKNIRRRAQNRRYSKKQNNNIVNEDWMIHGPVQSHDVPRGEIWIYESLDEAKTKLKEKFEKDRKENSK